MATEDDTPAWRRFVFGDENLPDPDYPLDHVPGDERKGLVSISAVLLGFVFFAGTIWAGAEVGAVLNGLVAAVVVHVGVYYLLESTRVLPGHDIAADPERL